eukprot:PhM_4_TR17778/c0_g1_i1/m.50933
MFLNDPKSHLKAERNERLFLYESLQAHYDVYDRDLDKACLAYLDHFRRDERNYLIRLAKGGGGGSATTTPKTTVSERVRSVLEDPFESVVGTIIFFCTILLVVLSVITALVETMPQYSSDTSDTHSTLWLTTEIVITAYFGLEFIARICVTQETWQQFVLNFSNVADVIALLPLFVSLIWNKELSLLRLLRMFRVFHFSRVLIPVEVLLSTLFSSVKALLGPALLVVFIVLLCSSILYYAERGEWEGDIFRIRDCPCEATATYALSSSSSCPNIPAKFHSIPEAMRFVLDTVTTVGTSGRTSPTPVCPAGRTVAAIVAMIGSFFIALPISVVGAHLLAHTEATRSRRSVKRVLERRGGVKAEMEDAAAQATRSPGEMLTLYLLQRLRGLKGTMNISSISILEKEGDDDLDRSEERALVVKCLDEFCLLGCVNCGSNNNNVISPKPPRQLRIVCSSSSSSASSSPSQHQKQQQLLLVYDLPTTLFTFSFGSKNNNNIEEPDITVPSEIQNVLSRHGYFVLDVVNKTLSARPAILATTATRIVTSYISVNDEQVPHEGVLLCPGDVLSFDRERTAYFTLE